MKKTAKTPNQKVTGAKKELGFQKRIESMQIAIAKGEKMLEGAVKRATDELLALTGNSLELAKLKIKSAANWNNLLVIYNDELKGLTLEIFTDHASLDAKRFLSRAQGAVTPEQEKVVIDFYAIKAKENFAAVERVRGVLELKKLLKPEQQIVKDIHEVVDNAGKGKGKGKKAETLAPVMNTENNA